ALTLVACGDGGGSSGEGETIQTEDGEEFEAPTTSGEGVLDVWTFTDEAAMMINDFYLKAFPDLDYEINISEVPTEEFETQLDPVLDTDSAPDIIFAEQAFVKKYVESGLLVDLSQYENIINGVEENT